MAGGPEILGVEIGDVATWAGAGMSFAAVVTALRLAGRESREKRRDSEDLERVFAPGIVDELVQLRWVCGQIALIHEQSPEAAAGYTGMLAHLQSCRCPTLDLVAARDVYRGDRGRKLMSLYAALLRLAIDLPRFNHANELLVVAFSKGMLANTAADLFEKASAALDSVWAVGPTPAAPIPSPNEPPGFRVALAT